MIHVRNTQSFFQCRGWRKHKSRKTPERSALRDALAAVSGLKVPSAPASAPASTHASVTTEECCVCLESHELADFKTLEPCLHKLCASCVETYVSLRIHKCPLCRGAFHLPSVKKVAVERFGEDIFTESISFESVREDTVRWRAHDAIFGSPRHRKGWSLSFRGRLTQRELHTLILHSHSRHLQASETMSTLLPPHETVELVDVQSMVVTSVNARDLSQKLAQNEHYRIRRYAKYRRYFGRSC